MAARSTPGIVTRHGRSCATRTDRACNCTPTFEAWVYSKRDGKKIRRSFPTLAAARGWRTDAAKAVKDKTLRAPTSQTLRDAVAEWLDGARAGRILNKREQPYKPAVIRNYELSLRLRVLPALGDRRLADLDMADLLDLKERLQGAGCSGSTVRNTFVPLQAIYRRARRAGVVATNPTIDLGLPTAGVRDRAVGREEGAELLEALPELERAVYGCALYAGLRRGEMRALRNRDVDLDEGTIAVEHGWDDKEGRVAPKSRAGQRKVFVLDVLRTLLEPLARPDGHPDALFFGSGQTPFEPKNVRRKALDAWAKENARRVEAELPLLEAITPHEARHSFSTFMDAAGISETRADRYMGHSNSSVSGRYRHQLPGQLAEDARVLDAYLAGERWGKVVPLAAAG